MSWLKWDDRAFDHPKMLAIGCAEKAIHWSALTFVAQQGTDGLIPDHCLHLIVLKADPELLPNMDSHVCRLVDVGLWERDESDRLWIHGWLDWNPTAETVADRREKRRRAGQAGADARWHSNGHSKSHSRRHGT